MAKKNLPNIPLYIGDWEKDCNVLSLQTEAAWLRIIFKMFTNGKQSSYKIPTKGLQNLWRVSASEVEEIIEELLDYNICEINVDGRFTEFTCRRFIRENEISESRKKAVSKRKDRTNDLQNSYKTSTNNVQTPDIDYGNDNEDEIKNNSFGKSENLFQIENEDLELICNYFSQTREDQKMKVWSFINRNGQEFIDQTKAYIEFKKLSGERSHGWNGYQAEWKDTDWNHKLDQEKKRQEKAKGIVVSVSKVEHNLSEAEKAKKKAGLIE